MESIIVIAVVAVIVGLALLFIYREKKRGVKCVGCPYAGTCGKCGGGCSKAE